MKKECTEEVALAKAEAYCSVAERCKADVVRKLGVWGAPMTSFEKIVNHLEEERYLDERRYAIAFTRDKYRFDQWGRIKIAQALKMKSISSRTVALAMEEIDEAEYLSLLTAMLKKKWQNIKAASDYERNGKLVRFAVSRGYEMDVVLDCMRHLGCEDGNLE